VNEDFWCDDPANGWTFMSSTYFGGLAADDYAEYAACTCGARLDSAKYGPSASWCWRCRDGAQPQNEDDDMAKIGDVFPSKWLKVEDLNGKRITVTIDRVEFEMVGQPAERKAVVYFKGKDKGLCLNKTNANSIHFITGSDDTDDWTNERIVVYPSQTEYQGKRVGCIRIDPPAATNGAQAQAPQPPPAAAAPADDFQVDDSDVPF
jgi:hypothetical protein